MKAQRGVALIALVAVLVLGASWYLVSALNAASNRTAIDRGHNAKLLAEAKQALLGWAAQQAADSTTVGGLGTVGEVNPGRLPCAEPAGNIGTANEGVMASSCGSGTEIGRLPWKSLGLLKPLDADGEPLWYVVSDGWKLNRTDIVVALGINSNKAGALAVDGTSSAAVAMIFAPGKPLSLVPTSGQTALGCATRTQTRSASPPNYLDYLECQNIAGASLRTGVTDNATNAVFNDQAIVVTAAEVMAAVEGAVATRIQSQVVPQIQSVYASSIWGATASNPVYPFAAPFGNTATSTFKGTAGTTQGFLPLTAYGTSVAGYQDAAFVQWIVSPGTPVPTATRTGGTATTFTHNCDTSTANQLNCTFTYSRFCIFAVVTNCSLDAGTVTIAATATNVGNALRTLSTSGITNLTSPSMTAPLVSSGAASASIQGTLPTTSCTASTYNGLFNVYYCNSIGLLGQLSNTATASQTVTVPITVFADHPFLNPATSAAWYWFIANRWFDATYYAVSPSHVPGGSHNCSSSGNCIGIAGGTQPTGNKAVLALMGRSLSNASRPSATLADYLDNAENRDLNTTFLQDKFGKTYNDRFVTISNY
jgi:hypothetical protein